MSRLIQKSKTGCITCRIRKVKCDEGKPTCKRCASTGRTCDGYQSNFRLSTITVQSKGVGNVARLNGPPSEEQVQHLTRTFCIKPAFAMTINYSYGPGISYEAEARATLAAVSEPAIFHALNCLAALRKDFQEDADPTCYYVRMITPRARLALQEYTHSLRHLGLRISANSTSATKYALLCCQLFINIELALDDFGSACEHFIRGLRIMHQSGCRPYLDAEGVMVPAKSTDLPSIDIFVIKLFLSPCPNGLTNPYLPRHQVCKDKKLSDETAEVVSANMQLAAMARETIGLLNSLSQLSSPDQAPALAAGRAALIWKLQKWNERFMYLKQLPECQLTAQARLGTTFSVYFYLCLLAIVTMSTQPPAQEAQGTGPIFEDMLRVACQITEIKKGVNHCPGVLLGDQNLVVIR